MSEKARAGFGITPLRPAYGRVYKNKEEVLSAWNAEKDFQTTMRGYCSKRDFALGEKIEIRYGKQLEKAVIVEVKEN